MISKNFLQILKWRIYLMKFSIYTYFSWDDETNRLLLKKNLYGVFSSHFLIAYCYGVGGLSFYHAIGYISAEPENGTNDIFDDDFHPRDEVFSILCGLAHLMHGLALTGLMGNLQILLLNKRQEFVDSINMVIRNSLRYQEMYKEQLNQYRGIGRFHYGTDTILLLLAVATVVTPFIFSLIFAYEFCPEHQILLRYFEIKVTYSWKFFPLFIYAIYMILQECDVVFIIDIGGMVHLNGSKVWLQLLKPEQMEMGNNGALTFISHLGCTLNDKEVFRIYKEQQLLVEGFNNFFGNHLTTGHHSALLYISSFGLFICIRHWRFIHEPGFLMALVAPVGCNLCEYLEVKFVQGTADTSGAYLERVGTLVKKEQRKLKKLQKILKSYRPLQPQVAYPYYKLTRENYLLYINSVVDHLVSFLVSFNL